MGCFVALCTRKDKKALQQVIQTTHNAGTAALSRMVAGDCALW